jgi:hypothetical protein
LKIIVMFQINDDIFGTKITAGRGFTVHPKRKE